MSTLILKNNSLDTKLWGGVEMPPVSTYVTQEVDRLRLLSDATFLTDLASATAIINNGTLDLASDVGLLYLKGTALDYHFNNIGNGFTAKNIQTAIEESKSSLTGAIVKEIFQNNGTSSNTWLNLGESPIPSNNSPFILPFDAKFIGVTFSNAASGVDLDIEIYVASHPNGSTVSKTFIYELRDVRTYTKTSSNVINPDLNLSAGDKISVYIRDRGTNPNDPIVSLYFKVLNDDDHTLSEDYSTSFSLTLGPITIILG